MTPGAFPADAGPPLPHAVLFDLDGTLLDPFEGLTGAYRHALAALGAPVPDAAELAGCIGPPLRRNFERLLRTGDRDRVERAVALFRERYGDCGWRQNRVYPGIDDLLGGLRAAGLVLYVATAKPEPFATRVAAHHGIAARVDGIFGPDLDGHLDDKARLVARALGGTASRARPLLLVGDREQDMRAARENGLPGVGVTWGYGSREELRGAGASWLCDSPGELGDLVLEVAAAAGGPPAPSIGPASSPASPGPDGAARRAGSTPDGR
jgi:phosphoglycolate phosphatase